jgi:hypothetical protein
MRTSTSGLPSAPPAGPAITATPELLRRDVSPNICGWHGGDSNSPAACNLASYCAVNTKYGVVGCAAGLVVSGTTSLAPLFTTKCVPYASLSAFTVPTDTYNGGVITSGTLFW